MTTIVTDGRTIVSDSLATTGNCFIDPSPLVKFIPYDDIVFAFAGTACLFKPLVEWYKKGAKPKEVPTVEECESWLWVFQGNKLYEVSNAYPYPLEISAPSAMGSGRPYATAALILGADPVLAVEAAIRCDPYSGGQVKIFELPENLIVPINPDFKPLITSLISIREGRRKGGEARAAKLSPERRAEIARGAAAKRWSK